MRANRRVACRKAAAAIRAFRLKDPRPAAATTPEEEPERRFRELVEDLDAVVWEAELDPFRFTYVSRRAERLLGHPIGEWLADGFLSRVIHAPDRQAALDAIWLAIGEGEDHELETRLVAADGSLVWMSLHTRVLEDGGRPRRLRGVMVDISRRMAAEEALARSEDQLRHAQKLEAIGRLAGGIAHDFNNLLTAITGYTEFLLAGFEEEDARRADAMEILRAAERAGELTSRLLAFGRRQPLDERVVDLNGVVGSVEHMLRRLIGEDVELVVQRATALGRVRVDAGRLEQVIVNLAVNARDAMPHGGRIEIRTRNVVVGARDGLGLEAGRYVAIEIADTGCGMDEHVRSHLFEPFFTTKEEGKGTGLGLATAYGIVSQSGGEIAVDTELGAGSTFRVYLPRVDEALTAVREPEPAAARRGGSETILLVEDELLVRRLVREVLERDGYRVLEASDGVEALRLAEGVREAIDLLVTDLALPQLSGTELAEQLAESRPALRVLLTSGYGEEELRERCEGDERLRFIAKPFLPDALAARVREVLDERTGAERAA